MTYRTMEKMNRQYYSERNNPKKFSMNMLGDKLINVYEILDGKDYFECEADISKKAQLFLDFQPFPIADLKNTDMTEDKIFDTIEFLYDYVSVPGERVPITTDSGYSYYGYENYDKEAGRTEYSSYINNFLCRYRDGYELKDGKILSLGTNGIRDILLADVPVFGDKNIDHKVQRAIIKWRNRQLDINERREAVTELANAFEWLKKSSLLKSVLSKKDEGALFDIANNFAIRHHNPGQKQNYDKNIWYSWMFHFYLATFHAVARMIAKKNDDDPFG
jgi:hypothetical protein